VSEVDVAFQWLTPIEGAQGRVVVTPEMLNIQWEKALLYPAGYYSRQITFQPTLKLPQGWNYGVALDTVSFENGLATFAPITLEHLADSPVFAGTHYRQIDLDPGGRSPVRLNVVADDAKMLEATDEHVQLHRNLVQQADRLFGARHFNHYDFLLAVTDKLGGIGLEHHRSSENSVDVKYFTDREATLADRDLLGHEYTHSWNGKWRRPADQLTPNLNEPLQNSLMWVYEGQTQYWGLVLTARAGLMSKQQALDVLAMSAASFQNIPGRQWRAMQDTTNDPIISQRRPQPWGSYQRSEDYYREGSLIWLDADTLIREQTSGKRSLDDFAKAFFGVEDGNWDPAPYTFADVTSTLNGVQANDWAAFLRERLDAVGPGSRGPLDGIERGGYRLVFKEEPSGYMGALHLFARLHDEQGEQDHLRPVGRPGVRAGPDLGLGSRRRRRPRRLGRRAEGGRHRRQGIARTDRADPEERRRLQDGALRLPRRPALPAPGAHRRHARPAGRDSGSAPAVKPRAAPLPPLHGEGG